MGEILKKGQKIKANNLICAIVDFWGSGSRGEAYGININSKTWLSVGILAIPLYLNKKRV